MSELQEHVQRIAATLGESKPGPLKQLENVLKVMGADRVQPLVE